MARINLLPWREELRAERQRQFLALLGVVLLGAVFAALSWSSFESRRITVQEERNDMLKREIRALDIKIAEIERLEATRASLLARKQVIENLQSQRSLTVMLLDELVKSTPVGVTLLTMGQQGMTVSLTGTTQSNARVSAYLQNLTASGLFKDPELRVVESKAERANSVEPYEFAIQVTLVPLTGEYDDEEPEETA